MNLNNLELDLNDPKVAEAIKAADVDKKPAKTPIAKQISERQKVASVTIKLTTEQLASVIRQAASVEQPWKEWFIAQVQKEVLNAKVQVPTISGPSWANKIKGPRQWD